jgi:hypothetical protein
MNSRKRLSENHCLKLAFSKGPDRGVALPPHLRMETSSFQNVVFSSFKLLDDGPSPKSQ